MKRASKADKEVFPERSGPGKTSLGSKAHRNGLFLTVIAWMVALGLTAFAAFLGWRVYSNQPLSLFQPKQVAAQAIAAQPEDLAANQLKALLARPPSNAVIALPDFKPLQSLESISRRPELHTSIPTRTPVDPVTYTVSTGDSVFGIATKFNIKPETVLWSNYTQLNDNPDMLSIGMALRIPPVNGVFYQWQAGDTIEGVAGRFKASSADILNWAGNHLDLTSPEIPSGAWVFIPGGKREFRQWLIPTIPRGKAGVTKSMFGPGACETGTGGANGTGAFVWPTGNHNLSGNDYWSGHLGIDIAAGEGAPIVAADSGVVVYAGWNGTGYGNVIMIDHGNGYQTLYSHLSSIVVACAASVGKGGVIGYSGSTGNSTGPHLHFEVRLNGGFVNPWYVLPAP